MISVTVIGTCMTNRYDKNFNLYRSPGYNMKSSRGNIVFLIKHKSSGKFIHPEGGSANPPDNTRLVVHDGIHDRMHFEFEPADGHFGYIRHCASGKAIHPKNGELQPENNTDLLIHSSQHAACLFGMDEINNLIRHKSGVSFHPFGGSPNPGNNTKVILHSGNHDASTWLFVNPNNPQEEVEIYGKPTVIGEWRIVNQVLNPKARHTVEIEIRIGKCKTESSSSTFGAEIETSLSFGKGFLTAAMTTTLRNDIQKSSAETWSEEQVQKRTFEGTFIKLSSIPSSI